MGKFKFIGITIVMLLGSIMLISIGVGDIYGRKSVNGGLDFNTMQEKEFKDNKYVKGDINFCFGKFAELETQETTLYVFKNSKITEHYYILPLTQFDEDLKYVAIACKSQEDIDELERITDETIEYMNNQNASEPTPLENYQGKIGEMNSELKQYMVEYFQEAELYDDDTQIDKAILPYTITYADPKDSYIFIGIGAVVGLIGLICIIIPIARASAINKRNRENNNIGPEIK